MKNFSKILLSKIEDFTRRKFIRLSELYSEAIKVCETIPNLKFASLFILEGEIIDFDLKAYFPTESFDENIKLLDDCINLGIVGKSLEFGTTEYLIKDESILLSIPLKSESGYKGILLIDFISKQLDDDIVNLLSLFGNILGNFINQKFILKDLEDSNSLLEQKIALKTMDINQNKRELEAIFNSVLTGIIIFDANTKKIIRANPVALELININNDEISEFYITEFLHNYSNILINNPHFSPFESEITTINKRSIPILRNTTYLNVGNKNIGIESFLDISVLKEAEKSLINANQILELKVMERTEDLQLLVHKLKNEITEREMAESELRRLFNKEKELNNLKTKFVSMVSHEFRTPLTIIRSSAQMLDKFRDNLSKHEIVSFYNKIMKSVDNMADLIENVIFIGKSESAEMKLNSTSIDIVSFCEQIIVDLKLSSDPNREIIFNYNFEDGTINSNNVFIDEKLLRLILYNLLSNAMKYSEKEKPIEFNMQIHNEKLLFEIIDFGIGIPLEEQTKIFTLFYRAENVGNITGTGLGLSVVVESLEKLGGKIELSSIINLGTKFIVTIPIKIMR